MTGLSFEPLVPASLFAFLATAGALMLALYARSRPKNVSRARWAIAVALMVGGFTLVMFVLLNPTLVRALPGPPGKPLVTILLDTSASMATADSESRKPRINSASALARELDQRFHDRYDVRIRTFADQLSTADARDLENKPATGPRTDLANAIAGSLDQDRPQGQAIVLLSDGIDNAGGSSKVLESVRLARSMVAPIFTRTFGGEVNTFDVSVQLRSPQDLAFIGQKVPISAHVEQTGTRSGKTSVRLLRGSEEIARREIEISPLAGSDALFMVGQEKIGVYPYQVRVDPLPGEVTATNNSASYVLRVVDEPIRVLVLEGKPYWDSKFLVRTLALDPAIALDSVVKVTEDRYIRRTLSRRGESAPATAPTTQPARMETWKVESEAQNLLASPERLKGYQIVVLGRDGETFLSDAAVNNLQSWIAQDGGSLVCYRGSPTAQITEKLGRLLPVRWSQTAETRFRVRLTEPGRGMNWWPARSAGSDVLAGLPTLVRSEHIEQTKPLAVVLATSSSGAGGAETPAVVYQQYGTGRVVAIEGAGMWRWAFLPPQYQEQEDVYRGLWQSLLKWLTSGESLTPGQKLLLRADKVNFTSGESATATLLVREDVARREMPRVLLTAAAGDAKGRDQSAGSFTPVPLGEEIGTYRVDFGNLPEGRYQARVAGAEANDASAQAIFEVRNFSAEQLDLRARPDLMQRIASDSGGAALNDRPADEIEKCFKQHLARTRPAQVEHISVWDRWWMLAVVFAVWGSCWAVRRASGLV